MSNLFNKIVNIAKGMSLTREEKNDIVVKISSYVKENPLNSDSKGIISPYSSPAMDMKRGRHIWYGNLGSRLLVPLSILKQKKFMPIILLLLIALGGGTSFAASSSLPGDVLYPIKVHVNEKIESSFALSAESEAKIQAKFANKRLEEAEKIAMDSDIDSDTKDKIKERFSKHADKLKTLRSDIKSKGKEVVGADSGFESALLNHYYVLFELSKNDENDKEEIEEINALVNAYLDNTIRVRSDEEKEISSSTNVEASAEASLNATNNKIEEVLKYIENKKEASEELKTKAISRLNTAKDKVVTGKEKLEAKAYGEAFILFQSARRIAQEAKLILNSESEFKINLNAYWESEDDENEQEDDGDEEGKDEDNEEKNNREDRKNSSTNTEIKIKTDSSTNNDDDEKDDNEDDNNNEDDEDDSSSEIEIEVESNNSTNLGL